MYIVLKLFLSKQTMEISCISCIYYNVIDESVISGCCLGDLCQVNKVQKNVHVKSLGIMRL